MLTRPTGALRIQLLRAAWLTAALLSVVLFDGCGYRGDPLESVFGSTTAIDVVRTATDVRVYRLVSESYHETALDGYEMAGAAVSLRDEQSINELQAILLDADTYEWSSDKGCEPDYGVRIEFIAEAGVVDVLLCFDCDILAVYDDGTFAGGEDFDNARSRLVRIAKQVFPDDELIQSLGKSPQ